MNKPEINFVTVFCASSPDVAQVYKDAAAAVGNLLATAGAGVITGAGNMGLMACVNNAAIAAGGYTLGIIPQFMIDRGWHHTGLRKLISVDNMHMRKSMMAARSMASIALPGGIGTLEEIMEIITWRQLGLYNGNIIILNINGYYDHLLQMLDTAVEQHFMRPDHRSLWTVAATPEEAVKAALAPVSKLKLSPKF